MAASVQIASITPAISLELTCVYSGDWCAEYEGPGVSVGAAPEVVGGGDGGERSEIGVGGLCTSGSGAGGSSMCASSTS